MFKNITRQLFARLNRHLPYRFGASIRSPMRRPLPSTPIPPSLSEHCLKMALMDEEALWKTFGTHPEGLNAAEVENARGYMAEPATGAEAVAMVGTSVGLLQPV